MQWATHTSLAVASGLCLGLTPPMLAGIAAGSVLPDALDTFFAAGNKRRWRKIHRGSTHWFGWYIACLAGITACAPQLNIVSLHGFAMPDMLARWLHTPATDALYGLAWGALSHIALDALNPMGVPLLPFAGRPRLRLPLVGTGTWKETLFTAFFLAVAGAWTWEHHGEAFKSVLETLSNM